MSEYTETVTICDRCHPDFLPSFTFFPLETIRGILRGDSTLAAIKGWEERDYGLICPDCVILEHEESDDTDTVMGLDAFWKGIAPNEDPKDA
jgi:hypothetical protein